MPLAELLAPDRIVLLDECYRDTDAVLEAAASLVARDTPLQARTIAASLREREQLGSTGIGHGVAIPHGRSAAYDQPRAAFLRLARPVPFGANDGQPVDLVFAIAEPEHFAQQHLHCLAELAEQFGNHAFRSALRSAPDVNALTRLMLDRSAAAA